MKNVCKIFVSLLLVSALFFPAFFVKAEGKELDFSDWEAVLEAANGTEVSFYGWGGSDLTNDWIDSHLAPYAKEHYGITVNRVPMDIDLILNKLASEKSAEKEESYIDLIWINGENFATAKDNEFLFGPFCDFLPNFNNFIDAEDEEVTVDFGVDVEGYEAPYSKAQLVFIYDSERCDLPFESADELLEFCKENPGQFTYQALPGFTGSAFVRNLIAEVLDEEDYEKLAELDKEVGLEEVEELIQPAIDFLLELKPYLWEKGETYPATTAEINNMFMDGQLLVHMSYDAYYISAMVEQEQYPESARSFVFEKGTVGNTNYIAIGANSKNIAGALCLADAILSPEMQASKMDPAIWGTLPVLDMEKVQEYDEEQADDKDDEDLEIAKQMNFFKEVSLGKGGIAPEELLAKRIVELPAHLVPLIEEIWLANVPGK